MNFYPKYLDGVSALKKERKRVKKRLEETQVLGGAQGGGLLSAETLKIVFELLKARRAARRKKQ